MDENNDLFERLRADRELIESEFGRPLEWEPQDGKQACRIAIYRSGTIEDSSENLQEIHDWAIQNVLQFKKFFGERIQPHVSTRYDS